MQKHFALTGALLLASTCLAQNFNWVKVNASKSPPGRWSHATAHDSIRGRTVCFGGTGTANSFMDDTWEFDGTTWVEMKVTPKPSGRRLTSMVYHFNRLQTLLFGGLSGSTYHDDTWVWDGKKWTMLNPTTKPPGRYNAALAYDSARGRTVLFGGRSASAYLDDTWEWDGTNWKQINITGPKPSARYTNMVYDVARKVCVIFGGWPSNAETWEFDGKAWKQITPKASPSTRCCLGLAYDSARMRTVMFGGFNGYFQETWEYDGTTWTKMSPAQHPPGRYDFDMMVYDVKRKRVVVFGGLLRSGTPRQASDTWEYTGAQALTGTPPTISIANGGAHNFALDAGTVNKARLYWIFGSITGTSPGVTLASAVGSVNIPLNPDVYTSITIAFANSALLSKTKGTLDGSGKGAAALNVPKSLPASAIGVKLYHAFLVYDAQNNFYMGSNPVELMLVK